jgi:hypothetical protein
MNVLAHLRTLSVLFAAFALFCALVTQMLARALGYPAALGESLFEFAGAPIYTPFSFLSWTAEWASVAPSLQLLAILIACVCALAAYSCAILVARREPPTLPAPSPWRGLASWDELRQSGLLGDDGLALGAVRRHGWAKHDIVRQSRRKTLFLGEPAQTNGALLAALSNWRGALVLFNWEDPTCCASPHREATGSASIRCWPFAAGFTRGTMRANWQLLSSVTNTYTGAHQPAPKPSLSSCSTTSYAPRPNNGPSRP